MSIFQDKKLILHISLEIIIIGSMTYFFHTKSKSLELRVKSIEEQFSKEISILQDSISQLKKQLKKSEMSIEEIKYSKNVEASNQSLPSLKKNGLNRVDTNRVDTNRVEKNRADTNKDEFESIVFNTFSISQGPPGPVYRQHATVELIDDIVENKERNDEENKEENKEENNTEEKEEKDENDNSSENGSLDRELENELKELEN